MKNSILEKKLLKYVSPDNLYQSISQFTSGMAVTKGEFKLLIEKCTLKDIEWNHMDQQHRPSIHNTYEKNLRMAMGVDFAVSLTQWGKWPFFITVSDTYVSEGLFYQSLTLAGIIFIHSVISMEEKGDTVLLKDEWYIASHKIFRFLHGFLNKKLYKLNVRLQKEDEQIRQRRFELRKKDFAFRSDPPNYYSSNTLTTNTIYPNLDPEAFFTLNDIDGEAIKKIAGLEFIVKKSEPDTYLIWPAVCPHEGGPLTDGRTCKDQIVCPWHSLRFSPVKLSKNITYGAKYGFEYSMIENKVFVKKIEIAIHSCDILSTEQISTV